MFKKVLSTVIAATMMFSMGSVCYAAEPLNNDDLMDQEIVYEIADVEEITDGRARASWGQGVLHSSDPVGANPSAYAETKTYSGTAYCMYAKTGLVDANGVSYNTEKQTAYNISTVSSATLLSPTASCDFIGYHGIQDTSSSGWQTATTGKSY